MMGAFIAYSVKCFFCLAFVYLFHRANRVTWLLLIPLSLLLPLFGSVDSQLTGICWGLAALYFAGVLFFLFRIGYGYVGMIRLVCSVQLFGGSSEGVVLILTKGGSAPKEFKDLVVSELRNKPVEVVVEPAKNEIRDSLFSKNPPLIIYDGEEMASMTKISPDAIATITVLKDKTAMEIYGEKGKNGVIIIVSKEKQAKKEKK